MNLEQLTTDQPLEGCDDLVIAVEEIKQPSRKALAEPATRDGDDGSEKDHDRQKVKR